MGMRLLVCGLGMRLGRYGNETIVCTLSLC